MRVALMLVLWAAPALAQPADDGPRFPRLHVAVDGLFDFVSLQPGVEAGGSVALAPWLDAGLGVNFGGSIGAMALLDFHLSWAADRVVRPFLQLRGLAQFASGGYGGGAWAGVSVELGPGRLKLGPAVFGFAPRPHYAPIAALVVGGYELDFLRPRARQALPPAPVEPVVAGPAPRLTGRLLSRDGRPLTGTVRTRSASAPASPDFALAAEPGPMLVEALAPGHLASARVVSVTATEVATVELRLKPAPALRATEVTPSAVVLTSELRFAAGTATLADASNELLDEVADVLIREPRITQVRIESFTDELKGSEANVDLAELRAVAVVKALVERGIDPTRLQARALSSRPAAGPSGKPPLIQFRIVVRQ